jgi:glycosyltransferase involved in cell wall biosynthesis
MIVINLTSSRFFGGPERQMLELAVELRPRCRTVFASFSEGGRCRAFLDRAVAEGFEAIKLPHDTPRLIAAEQDVQALLRSTRADVLLCQGYKAGLIGLAAARRLRVPIVAVSRGWTGECLRVRLYEALDRRVLRLMDRVVCVSQAQAAKVRRAGVRERRIDVIPNAIRSDRFDSPSPDRRCEIASLFTAPPRLIVGAAGRLSPEKGFNGLVDAAAVVLRTVPDVGFVLFGEGRLREALQRQITSLGLSGSFVLGGFRRDLDELLPQLDLFALPSHTEGLPNVVLESLAAGVPVVATAVGGTPEVLEDGISGYLVPPGDPQSLAARICGLLTDESLRRKMAQLGRQDVESRFSFASQAEAYLRIIQSSAGSRRRALAYAS